MFHCFCKFLSLIKTSKKHHQSLDAEKILNPCDTSRFPFIRFSTAWIHKTIFTWYAADSGLKRALLLNLVQVNMIRNTQKIVHFSEHSRHHKPAIHRLHNVSTEEQAHTADQLEARHTLSRISVTQLPLRLIWNIA